MYPSTRLFEWVSSFLMASQHNIGYAVPCNYNYKKLSLNIFKYLNI